MSEEAKPNISSSSSTSLESPFSLLIIDSNFSTLLSSKYISQILDIYQTEFENHNWPSLKTEKSLQITLNQCTLLFVAIIKDNSSIIGFGILTGLLNDPCIEDLIIHSNYRQQGYGKIIMNQLINHKKIQLANKIELYCKYELIEFYAKFGFQLIRGKKGERCLLRYERNKT